MIQEGVVVTRDGVANMVERLWQRGFEPRKVADDAWESRCPAHGGLERDLSITRNEFNHVVLECRGARHCQHTQIVRSVGFTNDLLYAETSDWLIGRLKREPIKREPVATSTERPGQPAAPVPPPGQANGSQLPTLKCDEPVSKGSVLTVRAGDAATAIDPPPKADCDDAACSPTNAPCAGTTTTSPGGETSRVLVLADAESPVQTAVESPAAIFKRLAGVERVIVGSDGRSYAVVAMNGRPVCCELKSRAFRHLLARAGMKATGKVPSSDAVAAAVAVLEADGEFAADNPEVALRVAHGPSGSSYFLDLADHDGRMIEVWADGWDQAVEPPVLIRRARGQLALPMPVRGGSLELLKRYVNIEPGDWPLFIGWLTAALRPVGPHPILVITGEQGAAKTTMLKVCRQLIDPNSSPVRSQPRELRDLMVAARRGWLMAYDNITSLPDWLSNGLCGLATGTGFTMRSLGTDDEETIFVAERPIILNGITDFVDRADVADRSYFLHLPPISRSNRRTEQAFWADFDRDRPQILGSLLAAVSAGMRMLPHVHLRELSRMADAERWGESVARGLGWAAGTFTGALQANRDAAHLSAVADSPVALTLASFMVKRRAYRGMMHDLLQQLAAISQHKSARADWPGTPRSLSCKLRQLAPQLRSIGIDVAFGRGESMRIVTITIVPGSSLDKSAPPESEQGSQSGARTH
jgi:hypothetical protein